MQDLLKRVEFDQVQYWESSTYKKESDNQRVRTKLYREIGIEELEQILEKVKWVILLKEEMKKQTKKIFLEEFSLGEKLTESQNPFIKNYMEQYESKYFNEDKIIRTGDDIDKGFESKEDIFHEEIMPREWLEMFAHALTEEIDRIKKKASQNIKIKNNKEEGKNIKKVKNDIAGKEATTRKESIIDENVKYTYLHKLLVYHLLETMSIGKKIPADF